MSLQKQLNRHWLISFFSIWTGQAFSLLGSQLVQFALIWWLTQKTGSATVLAIASMVGLLPQVLVGPLAGAIVDRSSRRLVMFLADSLVALITLGLVFLFWSGQVQIWHVYIAMFLRAVAGSFHFPAWQASISLMVPEEQLSRIQGFNQMLNGAMNIGSAPLGALLLSWLPLDKVLLVDVFTAALAVIPILLVRIPQPPAAEKAPGDVPTSVWGDMLVGMRFSFRWTGLVLLGVLLILVNLVTAPAVALIPILVTKHFGGQAFELAWMESAWGVGVVVGGLLLGMWGGFRNRMLTCLLALLVCSAALAGVGLAPGAAFWLGVGLMGLMGATNPFVNGPLMAAVQATVPPAMQGRVFTLMGSVAAGMMPLGLLVTGPLADRFGVPVIFVAGGLLTGVMSLVALFIPAIMRFEESRPPLEFAELAQSPAPAD